MAGAPAGLERVQAFFFAVEMLVGVLDHHDRAVDHDADGDRDAAEAHDVGVEVQQMHRQQAHKHAGGHDEHGDQLTAGVKQEQDAYQRDDGDFFDQRVGQRADGAVDEIRAVVSRHDGDAGRQAFLQILRAWL